YKRFSDWTAPTRSDDPDLAYRQVMLKGLLFFLGAANVLFVVVALVMATVNQKQVANLSYGIALLPAFFLAYQLAKRGRVTLPASIMIAAIFGVMISSTMVFGADPMTTIGYGISVLVTT